MAGSTRDPGTPPPAPQAPGGPSWRLPTPEQWMADFRARLEKRERHIGFFAITLLVLAAVHVVMGIACGAFFITAPIWDETANAGDRVALPIVGVVMLLLFTAIGVWVALTAWGIRRRMKWSRWSALAYCLVSSPFSLGSVCCLPITVWGIWALVGEEADCAFGAEPKVPPYIVASAAVAGGAPPSAPPPAREEAAPATPAATGAGGQQRPYTWTSMPTVRDVHKPPVVRK